MEAAKSLGLAAIEHPISRCETYHSVITASFQARQCANFKSTLIPHIRSWQSKPYTHGWELMSHETGNSNSDQKKAVDDHMAVAYIGIMRAYLNVFLEFGEVEVRDCRILRHETWHE